MGKKKLADKLDKIDFGALAGDLAELADAVKPLLAAVEKLFSDFKSQVKAQAKGKEDTPPAT